MHAIQALQQFVQCLPGPGHLLQQQDTITFSSEANCGPAPEGLLKAAVSVLSR